MHTCMCVFVWCPVNHNSPFWHINPSHQTICIWKWNLTAGFRCIKVFFFPIFSPEAFTSMEDLLFIPLWNVQLYFCNFITLDSDINAAHRQRFSTRSVLCINILYKAKHQGQGTEGAVGWKRHTQLQRGRNCLRMSKEHYSIWIL